GDRRGSRGDPGGPVCARGRRVRGRRVPPRGTPFGAGAGGVRRAGGRVPALAHEPRRDVADRARWRRGLERRRSAPAALPVARVASRPGGPRQGGGGGEAAGAGGARCGGAHDGTGQKARSRLARAEGSRRATAYFCRGAGPLGPRYWPTTTPSNVTDRGTTSPSVRPVTSRSLQRLRTLTRRFVMCVPLPTCPASTSSRFVCATRTRPKSM